MSSGLTLAIADAALSATPRMHEGHGRSEWRSSALHYLLEPEHAVPAAAGLLCVLLVAAWLFRRARSRARAAP